jgi:hypothetical protein
LKTTVRAHTPIYKKKCKIRIIKVQIGDCCMMSRMNRQQRKSYGMRRMGEAIGRAIQAGSGEEQTRAIRWAGAWGLLCGIRSPGVRLRRSEFVEAA